MGKPGIINHMLNSRECNDPEQWDEIIHDLGGHPLQLWGWGEVKSHHGWQARRVIYNDDREEPIGASQILTRHLPRPFTAINYAPRGPVWRQGREADVLTAVADYARDHLAGVALSIEPDSETLNLDPEWQKSPNTILIPNTAILDLTLSADDLLAAMAKKTRQYIRKSAKEAMEIKQIKSTEEIELCLAVYSQTAARAGFSTHGHDYYHDVARYLGDSSVIFAAIENGQVIAFLWLAVSSNTAFELYGGMTDRGQNFRANYQLKWHAITKCQSWGIERYDLNGLLNDGISTFKQGFADHRNQLVGSYDLPISPLYKLWLIGLPAAKKLSRLIRHN